MVFATVRLQLKPGICRKIVCAVWSLWSVTKVGCERCRPPEVPFIKIKFDAAFQATTSISSPFAAEALACLQPLKVGGGSGVEGGDGGG